MNTVKEGSDLDAVRIRALRRCIDERHLSVQHQSVDFDYTLSENLPDDWPTPGSMTKEAAERIRMLATTALRDSRPTSTDIEQYDHGIRRVHEVTCLPDRTEDGAIGGIVTIIADVTETRARDMALASLMREVSHRSRNLLAIVLSLAAQTASHAGSTDDFLVSFRGRVQALAWAQDLVTESNWRGTSFHALALAQLSKGSGIAPPRIRIEGDDPVLGPNAAMHVGLALHELVTNAETHGVLSGDDAGEILLDARLTGDDVGRPQLVIIWRERLLRARDHVTPPRFGSIVLRKVVPRSLAGTAEYVIGTDAVHYRLVVPADQFIV